MRSLVVRFIGTAILLPAILLVGCDKLGLGGQPAHSTQLPGPEQLKAIRYMSQAASPGPDGRRVFDHLEQAKSCHDLEIAMRWNRPPDLKGGPFNAKIVYVSSGVPANLPKNSEVYISGVVKRGESLPSSSAVWSLKLKDGSEVQAVESSEYVLKQEEAQQEGGKATILQPYKPGRTLCVYGIYQGNTGLALDQQGQVPLINVLFAMDRRK